MDAIILAGGIPQPDEPLYSYSNGESKALIDIAGRHMIQWVLNALSDAHTIRRIIVIGLSDKARLTCAKPLTYISNQGKLLDNLKAGTAKVLELDPKDKYVLFVSSDIPGITGQMVDWLVNTCMQTKDDLYYNVIRREAMEERFPTSKRTYTRLKDMEVCGGDMNMARAAIVDQNSEFWSRVLEARKNPAAQAALIGPDIIFKFLFRQLTIDNVIERVASKFGLKGRAIVCPFPEVGMDVDKPHQLEIMRAHLAERRGLAPRTSTAGKMARLGRGTKHVSAKPSQAPTSKTARRRARKTAAGKPRAKQG